MFDVFYVIGSSFNAANSDKDSLPEGRYGGFTNHKDSSVDVLNSRGNCAFSSHVSFVGTRRNGWNGNRNQPPPEGNHNRFAHAFELMDGASQEENMMCREESRQHHKEFMMIQQTNQQMMMAMFSAVVGRNVPNFQSMQQVPRGTMGEQNVSVSNKGVYESIN